ncbi:MAG: hypothetical protein VZR23_07475 [Lachnospiraceae bacterium]|nr:hypothetical protein [Lachnospiraceae bacterium]
MMGLSDISNECFRDFFDHRLTYDNVDYVVHENGTTVYDSNNHILGEYLTETEAKRAIRDMVEGYYI